MSEINGIKTCEIDECTCENGEGFSGKKCKGHGSTFCKVCDTDDGYFLNVNELDRQWTLTDYQMLLDNGKGAFNGTVYGYDWALENSFDIEITDHVEIESALCSLRICSCSSGSAKNGTGCPFHGELSCGTCDHGTHFAVELNNCESNMCNCEFGDGFGSTNCTETSTIFDKTTMFISGSSSEKAKSKNSHTSYVEIQKIMTFYKIWLKSRYHSCD